MLKRGYRLTSLSLSLFRETAHKSCQVGLGVSRYSAYLAKASRVTRLDFSIPRVSSRKKGQRWILKLVRNWNNNNNNNWKNTFRNSVSRRSYMMGTIFQNTRVVVQLSPITAFTRVFTSDHVDSRKENELLLTTRGEANLSNDTEG